MKHCIIPKVVCRLIPASALAAAIAAVPTDAANAGTTYYINNKLPGCSSDATNGGRTEDTAWCDFTWISRKTLGPGDRVRLARGARWNKMLWLRGEGADTAPIVLDAYGKDSEQPPVIAYNSDAIDVGGSRPLQEVGIALLNPSNFVVRDLEVDGRKDNTAKLKYGIHIYYTNPGKRNLRIENVYVHHNNIGILIAGFSVLPPEEIPLTGLQVVGVRGENNEQSITTTRYEGLGKGLEFTPVVEDAVFSQLSLINDDGQPRLIESTCDNALQLNFVENATVINSRISGAVGCYAPKGTAAILIQNTRDSRVVNNIIVDTQDSGSTDMTGVAYQAWTSNVSTIGNYVGTTAGAGIEVLGFKGNNANATVSSNVVVNYGFGERVLPHNEVAFLTEGDRECKLDPDGMPVPGLGTSAPTGVLSNNIYGNTSNNHPNGYLYGSKFINNGTFMTFYKFDISDNCKIPETETEVWFGARDFDSTQWVRNWGYAYSRDGQDFGSMTYNPNTKRWQMGNMDAPPFIDEWTMQPGPGIPVARVWRAPKAGTVTIRGFAVISPLDVDQPSRIGDGVGVQVVLKHTSPNGATTTETVFETRPIGSNSDDRGFRTTVNSLNVAAGDRVLFVVDDGGAGNNINDVVSWTPSIAYIDAGACKATVAAEAPAPTTPDPCSIP
ncbi:hypothetical protein [Inquilinus sp. Marseille-Q2685]|uniref:hypothetical protein n=1 Tax=Inquilinus sp. Marseille-Q2685 TaxID=2866581 RepID=UPI001CE3D59A|nr:hypothetical protein [Inquilinus sp. Marseille-Q2685]